LASNGQQRPCITKTRHGYPTLSRTSDRASTFKYYARISGFICSPTPCQSLPHHRSNPQPCETCLISICSKYESSVSSWAPRRLTLSNRLLIGNSQKGSAPAIQLHDFYAALTLYTRRVHIYICTLALNCWRLCAVKPFLLRKFILTPKHSTPCTCFVELGSGITHFMFDVPLNCYNIQFFRWASQANRGIAGD